MSDVEQPVLRPSRRLPSGRAVLGGLLITLAVLGVLLASRLGDNATIRDVVVARTDLAPGTVIEPEHVAQIQLRLAEDVDWVATDPSQVVGSVLLGPVAQLEFLQLSNVAEGLPDAVPSGLAVVSIEVDAGRTPVSLAAGELVSVVATYDSNRELGPETRLIAEEAIVLSYDNGDTEFGGTGDTVLRLGIADGAVASELVMASILADVSVIGVTGAPEVEIPEITS